VQLDLELPGEQAALGIDVHSVCAICGSQRARLWFDDSGRLIEKLGQLDYHAVANLQMAGTELFRGL